MDGWGLPRSLSLGGEEWAVRADFRDVLFLFGELEDAAEGAEALVVGLALFYVEFDRLPPALYPDAWQAFCDFVSAGAPEQAGPGASAGGKLLDWRQDAPLIVAEINRVAGREVRAEGFVHWFTFMGWFRAIGEGPLATVVGIRHKRARGKKLADWEREFLRENRGLVELRRPLDKAAAAEKARLLARLKQ